MEYFKGLAEQTGIPYQTLINLYLRDCAETKKELSLEWRPEEAGTRQLEGRGESRVMVRRPAVTG